ncbi:MAG: hypothetical protein JWO45_1586 [Spartobacteria bacterium]|nr:hypothetical protein [Spartobacteria bacterium]
MLIGRCPRPSGSCELFPGGQFNSLGLGDGVAETRVYEVFAAIPSLSWVSLRSDADFLRGHRVMADF